MAVYKIFAEKDATIYSESGSMNTGIDEILELSKGIASANTSESSAARILIKFSSDDINSIFNNYIGSGSFSGSLKLFLSQTDNIPTDYSIEAYSVYESWDMGTGRLSDVPKKIDGASWKYRLSNNTSPWITGSYPLGVTGSYLADFPGGGSWYTSSVTKQDFSVYSSKDVNIDVTNGILSFRSGSYSNNGFLLKISGSLEFNTNYSFHLSYFSRDTDSIYPPVLELKWSDYSFSTGSGYSVVTTGDINVSVTSNKLYYQDSSVNRFRVNVRDKYPTRTFYTGSIFTTNKCLPTSSYYSIQDLKTQDIVIDYDNTFTKISTDSNGNYFDLYMNGLEPGRYYKILIKTIIGNNAFIFDEDYIFKIE